MNSSRLMLGRWPRKGYEVVDERRHPSGAVIRRRRLKMRRMGSISSFPGRSPACEARMMREMGGPFSER